MIIDRTFIDEQGTRWIIDYKTAIATEANLTGYRQQLETYAFVDAIYTKKAAAQMSNASGYNTTVAGVSELLEDAARTAFARAYPGDALAKLWWWPDEPEWYAALRGEYRDRFIAA